MDGKPSTSRNRKRSQNFTSSEKDALLNAVFLYKKIIENKKTDGVTWKQKEEAWEEVGQVFNSKAPSGVYRTVQSLKKCYENMKKEGRKTAAHNKTELRKTGGGIPDMKTNVHDNLLLSIINKKTVHGLKNSLDSNGREAHTAQRREELSSEEELETITLEFDESNTGFEIESDKEDEEIVQKTAEAPKSAEDILRHNDWGDYNVNMLKTPLNDKLKEKKTSAWTSRRRPVATSLPSSQLSDEYSELAKLKKDIALYTITALKEERAEKTAEHKLQMVNLELEIELKRRKLSTY